MITHLGVRLKRPLSLLLCLLLIVALFPARVSGVVNDCVATSSLHTIAVNTTTDIVFHIENNDPNSISWLKITSPSPDVVITAGNLDGWTASPVDSFIEFTGGVLGSGQSVDATITVTTNQNQVAATSWQFEVSEGSSGLEPTTCTGDRSLVVSSGPAPPTIFDIVASNITNSSIRLSWSTSTATTTQINYGLSTPTELFISDNLTTTHVVTLDNLEAARVYYYYLTARDASNVQTSTGMNTFTTKSAPPNPVEPSVAKPGSNDLMPPTITLDKVSGVFQAAPSFAGTASDNTALATIDYSVDGGENWLPAENVSGLGSTSARFSFSPINLEDGDYTVMARAKDTANNAALSNPQVVTIDVLDPFIGGYVLYAGSQPLYPNNDGAIAVVIDTELDISINAIGGATSLSVDAKSADVQQDATFSLADRGSDNLWSGKMVFKKPGVYRLSATSRDGGGNISTRKLATLRVQSPAAITEAGRPVKGATVTVYYEDVETKTWNVWDGSVYSQTNPLVVNDAATYSYLLPEGNYYLKINANGYRTVLSNIFRITQPTAVGVNAELKKRPGFSIGGLQLRMPWPSFKPTVTITPDTSVTGVVPENGSLPTFSLPGSTGRTVSSVSILGKPTVLSLVSPWSLTARQQISILDSLPQDQVNVVAIGSGQSLARLAGYARLAGFDAGLVADAENQLINGLPAGLTPTTYFINRQGVVKSMSSKVLSQEEIINNVPF